MKVIFFDPVKKIILERERKIAEDLASSSSIVENFNSSLQKQNPLDIIHDAKIQAHELIEKALYEANSEKHNMITRELKDINANAETSLLQLEKQKREILNSLDTEVEKLSKFALEKILSELGAHATA